MYKTLEIAFYETRMSSRGWRFWLLLARINWRDIFLCQAEIIYIIAKTGIFFAHAGYSFQHPKFLVDDCHPEYWQLSLLPWILAAGCEKRKWTKFFIHCPLERNGIDVGPVSRCIIHQPYHLSVSLAFFL